MKNFCKLAVFTTIIISGSVQSSTIGAYTRGGLFEQDSNGGLANSYAYVGGQSSGGTGYGSYSYRAEASFNTGELTPVLRTQASFDGSQYSDYAVSAYAYALQTYQYTGASTATYNINLYLHGWIGHTVSTSNYIDVEFGVYTGTELFSSYLDCSDDANRNYISGFGEWSCGVKLAEGFSRYIEMSSVGESTMTDLVTFTVNPGDTFMIYASMRSVVFGGYADAFDTMTMNFDDKTDLIALGNMTVVPVPAAFWLFGAGIVALTGMARRKN